MYRDENETISTIHEKILNCQASDGSAMLFSNEGTYLEPRSIAFNSSITLPVYQISGSDLMTILSKYTNFVGRIIPQTGQSIRTCDCLAAAHVVGAIARIWRARRSCNNTQVIQCLKETALDLGPVGRDDEYGHGLVQTKSAYECLKLKC
jgi:serine protease